MQRKLLKAGIANLIAGGVLFGVAWGGGLAVQADVLTSSFGTQALGAVLAIAALLIVVSAVCFIFAGMAKK